MSFILNLLSECFGSTSENRNDGHALQEKANRPHLSTDEASRMHLNEFINRSLISSPSVVRDREAFANIYQDLLYRNQVDAGQIARQVEGDLVNLSRSDVDKNTNSWAIQLIGMAIDHGRNNGMQQQYSNPANNSQQQNNWASVASSGINNTAYPAQKSETVAKSQSKSKVYVKPYFFPSEDSFKALVGTIRKAQRTLEICVFSITDDDVKRAILEKHQSGVHVRVISDDDQAKGLGSDILELRDEYNIEVKLDNKSSYMHNKFCIVDKSIVVTGSYNWSKNARKNNQENIVITNSEEAINGFSKEFEKLWAQF